MFNENQKTGGPLPRTRFSRMNSNNAPGLIKSASRQMPIRSDLYCMRTRSNVDNKINWETPDKELFKPSPKEKAAVLRRRFGASKPMQSSFQIRPGDDTSPPMNVSKSSVFGAPVNVAGYTLRGNKSRSFNAGPVVQKPSTSTEFYHTNFVAATPKKSGNLLQRSSSIILPSKIYISSKSFIKRQSNSPAVDLTPPQNNENCSFGDKIQNLNRWGSFLTDKEFNPVKLVSPTNRKVVMPELSKPGSLLRMPSHTSRLGIKKTNTGQFKTYSKSIDKSSMLSNMSE